MAACAYWILQQSIVAAQGEESRLKEALGSDWKGKLSPVAYIFAIGATFWIPWVAEAAYVAVALLWLVPDRRIESRLARAKEV